MPNNCVSVSDAAMHLKVSNRAIQGRCKRSNVLQVDGAYKIPLDTINKWLYGKGLALIGQSFDANIQTNIASIDANIRNDVRVGSDLSNEVAELKKECAKLSEDVKRYREVLVNHGRIFTSITDRLNDLGNQNEPRKQRIDRAAPIIVSKIKSNSPQVSPSITTTRKIESIVTKTMRDDKGQLVTTQEPVTEDVTTSKTNADIRDGFYWLKKD